MDKNNNGFHAVLIVDADIVVRASLAAYLGECGLRVLEANDTSEAETVISEIESQVDIVLCDAGTLGPELSFAFARWFRSQHQDVPVLLAGSIETAASLAGDLCEEGPQLSKSYDHTIVVDVIREALARNKRNLFK